MYIYTREVSESTLVSTHSWLTRTLHLALANYTDSKWVYIWSDYDNKYKFGVPFKVHMSTQVGWTVSTSGFKWIDCSGSAHPRRLVF